MTTMWSLFGLALLASSARGNVYPRQSSGSNASRPDEKISAAWYAAYHSEQLPLDQVSWEKLTNAIFSFATTTNDVEELEISEPDQELLPEFVSTAHEHGVIASISIGGWGGSLFYSSNLGSAENRTKFVKTVTDVVERYELDGVDFDWEFPNNIGIGCNTFNSNDTSNYLSFLKELRQTPTGSNLTISAASTVTPFLDSSGSPSTNVSEFADVLDYLAIMNYDIWSYYSNNTFVGPSAPLNDTCAPEGDRYGSAVSGLEAWTNAGFPADKLVLAVPAYGHGYNISRSNAFVDGSNTTLRPYASSQSRAKPWGDRWDGAGEDVCGVDQPPTGTYAFRNLILEGWLQQNGSARRDIGFRFDDCSQTPYAYNSSTEKMVSYDDVDSIARKGQFIGSTGMKGFSMWEAAGDYNDLLLDSILNAVASTPVNVSTGSTSPSDGALTLKPPISAWTVSALSLFLAWDVLQ